MAKIKLDGPFFTLSERCPDCSVMRDYISRNGLTLVADKKTRTACQYCHLHKKNEGGNIYKGDMAVSYCIDTAIAKQGYDAAIAEKNAEIAELQSELQAVKSKNRQLQLKLDALSQSESLPEEPEPEEPSEEPQKPLRRPKGSTMLKKYPQMRVLLDRGMSQKDVAALYGVSPQALNRALKTDKNQQLAGNTDISNNDSDKPEKK